MSEASEAKRDGAKLQKNSGRGMHKGDAILSRFLIDYKEASKSFSLNTTVWGKVSTDAIKEGYDPALKVILGTENKVRVWIVPDSVMHELIECWEAHNEV